MKSVGAMIKQLEPMTGTSDLTQWENEFVSSVVIRSNCGTMTQRLTEKQLDVIQRIYRKHFGDA